MTGKILKRWPAVGAIILFGLVPLLAFPELIGSGQTLYWTDLSWIHYPRHIFAAEEWLAGRVPLWDPYEDTGIPLLAESQVGVLYPFSALFLSPLPPSLELSLFILLHFSLAGLFTFSLARSLGLGPPAASLAGLAFGCGGFLMAQVPNLNLMSGAVWLPLLLLGVRRALLRRTLGSAMLAGLPFTLQILTAQPQIVVYSGLIVTAYVLYRIIAETRLAPARLSQAGWSGLLWIIAVASGLLLAAPQLLPTLELQQLSVRAEARDFDFLTKTSLPPLMLLNFLLPGAFGNNVVGFAGGDPFQEVFGYTGFVPLLLALGSWPWRRRREVGFFYMLLLGSLLLALGRFTPLYAYLIQYLPGLAYFRIPARWLVGVNFALAMLAGFGLERLAQQPPARRSRLGLVGLALGLALIVIFGWYLTPQLLAWSEAGGHRWLSQLLSHSFRLDPIYPTERLGGSLAGLRIPAVLLLANLLFGLSLFFLWWRQRVSYRPFAGGLILATVVDLVAAGGSTINPLKPAAFWQQRSGAAEYVLANLGEARVFPLGMGSEAATVSHLGQYFPAVYRVHSAGGHGSSLRLARYSHFLNEADPVRAVQLLGVKYLLTLGQLGADAAATYPLVYNQPDGYVYENQQPLPRAFVVHERLIAASPAEAFALVQDRRLDLTRTVILEPAATQPVPPAPESGEAAPVTVIEQTPQVVELAFSAERVTYLVLLDTYYPGWQATVDGQPRPIYRANYIGRAVFVPGGGEHRVRFVYNPLSFRIGLWLWAGTGLMMAGLACFSRRWLRWPMT